MINITTDVAVVGSGTGGVSAAYHCAIAGLNTTLFEAGKGFGPALTGVNGVFAVGTAYQKSKHINESKKDIFLRLMNHANWLIDARQVTEFLNRSAGIWQWLESLGCEAEAVLAYNMDAPHTWHYFNAAKPRLEVVGKAFLDAGGTLQDGAYMNELIMEDGRVVGIKGETENGEPIEVHCKAVVLATGEPQRIAKPGDGPGAGPAPRGDGLQKEKPYGIAMATRVGAAQHANTYSAFNMNVKPPEYDVPDVKFPGPTEQYFRQPQELMVNLKAQRFTTEEVIHAMEDGASAIASQPAARGSPLTTLRNSGKSPKAVATVSTMLTPWRNWRSRWVWIQPPSEPLWMNTTPSVTPDGIHNSTRIQTTSFPSVAATIMPLRSLGSLAMRKALCVPTISAKF